MMDSKDFKIKWYYYIPIYGLFKLYIDGQGVVVTETKEFIFIKPSESVFFSIKVEMVNPFKFFGTFPVILV